MALHEKAVLVRVTLRQWYGRKFDKAAAHDLSDMKGATREAGSFYKKLVKSDHLHRYEQISAEVRTYCYNVTMPWADGGTRILPNSKFMEFMNTIGEFKAQLAAEADEFLAEYDTLVSTAERELGNLFNIHDYPPARTLAYKFGAEVMVLPIPAQGDIRVEGQTESHLDSIAKSAKVDAWNRISTLLTRAARQFGKEDGIIRNSLLDDLNQIVDVLPDLNITDDAEINATIKDIKKTLTNLDRDALKEDPKLRSQSAKAAEKIASKAKKFLSDFGQDVDDEDE